ncbi:multidrug resistance-associated protein 4-like [Centruroides sculpturatus]|uniref:multidrug resistance-associated protein 4-like n=1 Tax=Centruroides sculpturatus TaxID=218467 RepID=UPI000C6DBAF7|nr:multidrug resistance-associated protein 4-like [Centruroides sculpturatus]
MEKQQSNTYDSAGVFSRLFFCWLFPIIIKGKKRLLKEVDLYETSKYHTSEYLGNKLQKEWNKELQKSNPSTVKAILRFIGWKYLIVILLVFIQETVVVTSKAYILGLIIYYFDNKSEWNEPKLYLLAAGFCGLTAIYLLTFNTNYFISEVLGMKLKVALCTVIYNKAINLSSSSLAKSNIGQIVNLLANDVNKFYSNIFTISYLITNPFLLIIAVLMLWQYCRWATLVGLSVIFLYVPLQIMLGKLYSKLRLQAAVLGDERLNLLNEVIAGMRLVKMYTWELPFASLIEKIRKKEMKKVKMFLYTRGLPITLGFPVSRIFTCLTLLAIVLFGSSLDAYIVFVTMCLSIFIYVGTVVLFSKAINFIAEIWVSLKRIQDFLLLQEKENNSVEIANEKTKLNECGIWMKNVTATWNNKIGLTLNGIKLCVQPGELLAVIGSVGSGKTSLLMSILGEIPIISGTVSVKGKISYSSQEAWIFNGTIRENIIFGEEYQEEKYRKVLHITTLEKDFLLLQEKENNSGEIANEKTKLNECGIWMKNVTATWNNKIGLTLNGIKLCVQPGELLAVIGSVGSGKTSLLMSILGEIPIISGTVSVKGKISYSSQEAWIFNGTIRENIIFGEEYQEEKYRKVLHITTLEKDIRLFPKGDLTLVGERGVIMSGGQKARINLARALYLDADIFLLDDPLSAVDGPVARHLFQKCIMEYLNDKTCILVTHQTQFLNSTTKVLMLNGVRK